MRNIFALGSEVFPRCFLQNIFWNICGFFLCVLTMEHWCGGKQWLAADFLRVWDRWFKRFHSTCLRAEQQELFCKSQSNTSTHTWSSLVVSDFEVQSRHSLWHCCYITPLMKSILYLSSTFVCSRTEPCQKMSLTFPLVTVNVFVLRSSWQRDRKWLNILRQ